MAARKGVARGWAYGSFVLILLATLTPQAGSPGLRQGFFVPPPTDPIGATLDALQNLLLYVPLGLALGLRDVSWIRTLLTASAVSLTTEFCQFLVPGRDPVATDVLINVCGAALAHLVVATPLGQRARRGLLTCELWWVRALRPERSLAETLSFAWALLAACVVGLTCWLLSVALPGPFYYLISTPALDDVRGSIRIGSDGSQQGSFRGLIDEVRIYSRARTGDEILFDLRTPVSTSADDPDLLVAYGFDSNDQGRTSDKAGGRHDAFVTGATWTAVGRFGGALTFDGVISQLTVPHLPEFGFRDGMTLEAWVKPAGKQEGRAAIVASPGDAHFLRAAGTSGALNPSGGGKFGEFFREARSRRRIPSDRWTHLAATYNGETLVVYIDGEPSVMLRHWSTHHPLNASIDGVALPPGTFESPSRLWSLLSRSFTLDLTFRCGPLDPRPAPVFAIIGVGSREVFTVDASGSELRVGSFSRGGRLRLAPIDYRFPGALSSCAPGETRSVVVKGPLPRVSVEDGQGRPMPSWEPGVGAMWAFLVDCGLFPTPLVVVVSAGYLALLALPFGFWARRGPISLAAGVVLAGALAIAPRVSGTPPVNFDQAGAIAGGVLIGAALSRATANKHRLDRLKHNEEVERD